MNKTELHATSSVPSASELTARPAGAVRLFLSALGSPRLTTLLFVLAMGLVVLGTLAQVYQDMWEVIDAYFRGWVAWVDLKVLFPPSFFPWAIHTDWDALPINGFPFPGGVLIGSLLFINLTAAHATRFTMKARGPQLVIGLIVLVVGIVTTWLVIESGHNRHGVQGEPLLQWTTLWMLIRLGLGALWVACVSAFFYIWLTGRQGKRIELGILAASSLGLALLLGWLVARGDEAALTDSSLRILYQLIQGQIAATVLLIACVLLFRKRAGIALLHGGVGLLMFGEFFVSHYAVEQQITLQENETVGTALDIRSVELAIRAPGAAGRTKVTAIPIMTTGQKTSFSSGKLIHNQDLPFDAQVVHYFENSEVRPLRQGDKSPANQGAGTRYVAEAVTPRGGVKRGNVDIASAYVKFMDPVSGADLGTYLLSQHFSSGVLPQSISVHGKQYGLELRFQRTVKPYTITLKDVRKDDYVGTAMPRNYSSLVRLQDPSRNVDLETKIWMNNPLRYAGETFYQSGYNKDAQGRESSTLQVVRNTGWMIPYVSCMIVATGMFTHFLFLLLRFLRRIQGRSTEDDLRTEDGTYAAASSSSRRSDKPGGRMRWAVPIVAVCFGLLWIGAKAKPPNQRGTEVHLEQFGTLPVMYEGRVKPFDTLARNSLRILSNRETYRDKAGNSYPAIRWLLDVIARPEIAEQASVFRIDSLEVLETFGLERRKGFRYSWNELRGGMMEFQKQVGLAQQQSAEERTFFQRKILDLAQRVGRYRTLSDSFQPLPLPPFPGKEAMAADREAAVQSVVVIERLIKQIPSTNQALASRQPPLSAPVGPATQPWLAYAAAQNAAYVDRYMGRGKPSVVLAELAAIFTSYEHQDVTGFNQAVADYREQLGRVPPVGYNMSIADIEAYFNYVAPFYNLLPLYFIALLLTVFGWLGAPWPRLSEALRSGAFWLVVCAFIVHSFALAARVAISGRPPVTNLYSSAVFIGWGCVFMGLFLEYLSRMGIGNFVASVMGIGALIVAHFLAGDGDTIRVLQAVLDTQFWLTTHVLTIALGYSATFLAGILGIVLVTWYLIGKPLVLLTDRFRQPARDRKMTKQELDVARFGRVEKTVGGMIFGTICFAAFLSFVGTVLGGLWADDSWGRFWGWDPKENGALVIVLWNTLVLHAYGARMVRERGLALLAIGGNLVTAWSWFGVNELGVGLHSYGFTEGAARALLLFWISQLVVIGLGLLPVMFRLLRGGRSVAAPATG